MPVPPGATLQVDQLAKRYGTTVALRDVSFTVAAGEVFGLLGPNGAGKTTALECIVGLRTPDAGRIHINAIDALADPAAARAIIGAQLQAAALHDTITVREALQLFGGFYPTSRPPAALIEAFGLGAFADARFGTLSGGQKQRVFLALALVHDPALVVLDEPTAGLDVSARRALHETLAGLHASGRTLVISTHDLEEAERLCDRVAIIDAGAVVACGTPATLIQQSAAPARVMVRTDRTVPDSLPARLPAVVGSVRRDDGIELQTTDPGATISELTRRLQEAGDTLRELRVRTPSLEDAFVAATGHAWPTTDQTGAPRV